MVFALVGYHKENERLAFRKELAPATAEMAAHIIGEPLANGGWDGDLELLPQQAKDIARLGDFMIDTDRLDFFLEPYHAVSETA